MPRNAHDRGFCDLGMMRGAGSRQRCRSSGGKSGEIRHGHRRTARLFFERANSRKQALKRENSPGGMRPWLQTSGSPGRVESRAFGHSSTLHSETITQPGVSSSPNARSTLRVLTNTDTESEEATRHKGCRIGKRHRDLPSFCATNERDGSAIPSHLVPAEAGSGHGQVRAVCDA